LPLPERRPTDLANLLDEVVSLYASEPGLIVDRGGFRDLPSMNLDPDQIAQALKNVVGNAVDAMRSSTRDGRLSIVTEVEAGVVLVEVVDNGPGFDSGDEERVFEPYFTKKAEGTGLGMSITYRIVTEHGGVISASNRQEGGARVRIRLPVEAGSTDGVN